MSEHTPTPWHLEKQDPCDMGTAIGEPIAVIGGEATGEGVEFVLGRCCDFGPHGNEQTEANARLIHRAVNAHDDLLGACKAALTAARMDEWGGAGSVRYDAFQSLAAAIAKAEEK